MHIFLIDKSGLSPMSAASTISPQRAVFYGVIAPHIAIYSNPAIPQSFFLSVFLRDVKHFSFQRSVIFFKSFKHDIQ